MTNNLDRLNFGKHCWVCSMCGQGLTRRSTAIRHNNNLHSGGAMIVRPFDYIIGRLKGDFFPNDPSFYRRHKKNQMNGSNPSYYHNNDNRNTNKARFGGVRDKPGYGNEIKQRPIEFNTAKTIHDHQSVDPLQTTYIAVQNRPETMLKISEIEILAKKYYSPQDASWILSRVAYLAIEGKSNDYLSKCLDYLRNIVRARSY
jgi:hypothetical protein